MSSHLRLGLVVAAAARTCQSPYADCDCSETPLTLAVGAPLLLSSSLAVDMDGALRPGTVLLEKFRVESQLGRGGWWSFSRSRTYIWGRSLRSRSCRPRLRPRRT